MAFKTLSGFTSSDVGANGLKQFTSATPPLASDFNNDFTDEQAAAAYGMLAGVLSGGAITAAALNVTIPAGLTYFARQVWINDGSVVTVSVPDASTTYLWGCSDGQIRQTATTTPPSSFDNRTACILTKVVSSGGNAAVDDTARQRARTADGPNHVVSENAPSFAPVMDTIPAGAEVTIAAGSQQFVFDSLLVSGILRVSGKLRITA